MVEIFDFSLFYGRSGGNHEVDDYLVAVCAV